MTHTLTATHEGADLQLTFSEAGVAQLIINSVARESANAGGQNITLKLGSPVQTGYEHHEFIEAIVNYQQNCIQARLSTGDILHTETEVQR